MLSFAKKFAELVCALRCFDGIAKFRVERVLFASPEFRVSHVLTDFLTRLRELLQTLRLFERVVCRDHVPCLLPDPFPVVAGIVR